MRININITRESRNAQYFRGLESRMKQAVQRSTNLVRNEAINSIQRDRSIGETYEKYGPRRTHIASAPGQPPNTDTGNLVRNIQPEFEAGGMIGFVFSRAIYSRFLEFGTIKMSARPFLQPALESVRQKIRHIFAMATRTR